MRHLSVLSAAPSARSPHACIAQHGGRPMISFIIHHLYAHYDIMYLYRRVRHEKMEIARIGDSESDVTLPMTPRLFNNVSRDSAPSAWRGGCSLAGVRHYSQGEIGKVSPKQLDKGNCRACSES